MSTRRSLELFVLRLFAAYLNVTRNKSNPMNLNAINLPLESRIVESTWVSFEFHVQRHEDAHRRSNNYENVERPNKLPKMIEKLIKTKSRR